MLIGLDYDEFLHTELWKIRNRCFLEGEQKVLWKIDMTDQLFYSQLFLKSQEPGKKLEAYYNELKDLVQPEIPMTPEEKMDRIRAMNKKVIEDLTRG